MPSDSRLVRLLRGGVVSLSALFLLAFMFVAARRMGYPYELEWLEGGGLDSVRRLLAGEPLYDEPSLDFIAYPYTPLYYQLAALCAWVSGSVSFFTLRALSAASTLVALVLIAAIVHRDTRRWDAAVVAAGVMLATYELTEGWFDIARVDPLFLALFLAGVYAVQVGTPRALVAGGVLLAASFLTKQTALLAAAPLLAWCIYRDGRKALLAIGPFVFILAATTVYYQWSSHGWYWYYVVELQRHAGFFMKRRLVYFWTRDLLTPLFIILPVAVLYLLDALRPQRRAHLTVAVAAAAMIGAAYLSRLRTGNSVNTLMPAFAGLAILAGCAVGRAGQLVERMAPGRRSILMSLTWLLCGIQLASLVFNPIRMLPSAADRLAGDRLVKVLAAIDGDVLVPCEGYLAVMAGKRGYAHLQEMIDITRVDDRWAEKLRRSAQDALRAQRFAAVVPCRLHPEFLEEAGLDAAYARGESLFASGDRAFLTVAAIPLRPETVYRPRSDPGGIMR